MMLSDVKERLQSLKKKTAKRYIFLFLKILLVVYIGTYGIAFVMKGHANNEWVRLVCREYVYGPKNIAALVINKFVPGFMKVNSVFVPQAETIPEPTAEEKAIRGLLDRYNKQAGIDERLRAEYEAGGYTLEEPFVVINPYGNSPLTALIMFDTDEEMLAGIRVVGKAQEEDVNFVFEKQGYCRKHVIPVYGLYAGYENTVVISISTRGGQKYNKEVKIATEDLPANYEKIHFNIYQGESGEGIAPGFNFSYGSIDCRGMKYAFDRYGNIRWLFTDDSIVGGTNYMKGSCIYRAFGYNVAGDAIIVKESYLGKIEQLFYLSNGMHHDLFYTDKDTLLATTGSG